MATLEHVALYVEDLEGARDFFERYLGAASNDGYRNATTGFRSYFLSFTDGSRLEIMWRPKLVALEKHLFRTGYAHLAFSLGNKTAVDELTELMVADGFELVSGPRVTGDGYYESCLVGFEGNLIELTA